MRGRKILAGLFGLLAACAAALGIFLAFSFLEADPVLLVTPEAAKAQAQAVLDAVCQGDYVSAAQGMYGTPDLGVDREAADTAGALIWDAFENSLSYTLEGACYATDSGVAQDVAITALDIDSVTANLRTRAQTLLEERVAAAADVSEVYEDSGEYREDVVMEVLYQAIQQALEEDAVTQTVTVPVSMIYSGGQWWVLPESDLLRAISGGMVQ